MTTKNALGKFQERVLSDFDTVTPFDSSGKANNYDYS